MTDHLQQSELETLRAFARSDVAAITRELLGEPNQSLSTRRTWRYGQKGALAVEINGPRRGVWFSHEDGAGGDLISLIRRERRCSFGDAVQILRDRFGGLDAPLRSNQAHKAYTEKAATDDAEDRARRIATAARMAAEAVPLDGTVGERYLVEARAIPRPASGWPNGLGYHPQSGFLLAIATTETGAVRFCQRISLTIDGRKVPDRPKLTNGIMTAGACVRLPAWRDYRSEERPPLIVAEGPESGASAWAVTGRETWISCGLATFKALALPHGRRVVLARDDDASETPADKFVRRLLGQWRTQGYDVVIATPWPERRHDKSDLNDLLQAEGAVAVARRIDAALSPSGGTTPPDGGFSVEQTRQATDAAAAAFFSATLDYDPDIAEAEERQPPVHAAKIPVGIGKSHAARHHAVAAIRTLRAKGDKRVIVFAVPTHRLGNEQRALFQETAGDLTVRVWRGRGAENPEMPGTRMCQDLEAIDDALSVGADPQTAVCRKKPRGRDEMLCPHFATCAYQEQRRQRADIWIVPHELIFSEKPTAMGDLAALVVDEACWQDGLEGLAQRADAGGNLRPSLALTLDALTSADRRHDDHHNPDWHQLLRHRESALGALRRAPNGPLRRDDFLHLSVDNCAEARRLELLRKNDVRMRPGMSRKERQAAVAEAAENRTVFRRAKFWSAFAALVADDGPPASGWLRLLDVWSENGSQRLIEIKGRRPIREGWQVPTLLIDATLNLDLVRPFWPQVEIVADISVSAPHQRIRQVVDRSYAKSRIDPLSEEGAAARPDDAAYRHRQLRQVRAIVTREARRWPDGRLLVVAQKGAEEGLLALGLPPNVETGHHNAVAGQDRWRDVQGLVVVGRTVPRPSDVERMAEALTGEHVPPLSGFYQRVTVSRQVVGLDPIPAEVHRHPHPVAEAIRWQTCEGELVQIIGRGRGVNRTAVDPLDVLVMTDPVLPQLVEPISAADLEPTVADRMLAEGGVVFENAAHAAAAYPALWPSKEAAKKAFGRGQIRTNPYVDSYHRGLSPSGMRLRAVDYQRTGARNSPANAWFDPLLCPDPETRMTEWLGPLAWCRVEVAPESDPAPPPAREPPMDENAADALHESPGSEPPISPRQDVPELALACDGLDPAALFPPARNDALLPPDTIIRIAGLRVFARLEPSPHLGRASEPPCSAFAETGRRDFVARTKVGEMLHADQ